MEKIKIFGTAILLILLIQSCHNNENILNEVSRKILVSNNVIIENQINSIEKSFKELNANIEKNEWYGEWYKNYVNLKLNADRLILNIGKDKFQDSLNLFIKNYDKFSSNSFSSLEELKISNNEIPKEIIINQIRTVELLLANKFYNFVYQDYFVFDKVKPIVVPDKNPIKLGGTFSAQIFMVAVKTDERFAIENINPSWISYDSNNIVPIIKFKPTIKGKQKIVGRLLWPINNKRKGQGYNFEYEYIVD